MKNKIILLVEDNLDDVTLTLRAFRKSNIVNDVVVVYDGQEALDYLFGKGSFASIPPRERPALVLLDLKIPKIDGLEVLRRMRTDEQLKFLPVVILTSSKEEQDLVSSYKLGANSYIRKPVEFSKFVEAVGQLELYWMVLNEVPQDI